MAAGPVTPRPPAGCGGRPSAGRAAGAAPRGRPRSGTRGLLTCVGAGVLVRPARGVRLASGVIVAGESGSGGRAFWILCEDKLRELGLLGLERRWLWGTPNNAVTKKMDPGA